MVSGLTPPSRRRDEDRIKSEVEEIQEVLRHGSSSTGISAISGGNMSGDTSPYTAPVMGAFSVNPVPHIQSYQIMFTEPKNASNVNPPFAPTNTTRITSGNIIKSSNTTWEGELLWIVDNKINDDPNTKIGIFQPHNQANLTFTDSAQTFTMVDNTGTTVSGWTATYVTGSLNQYFDKVLPLRSSSCIISDLNGGSASIKNIIGGTSDGQLVTLKPLKGTTLTLETGGNIEISSNVTVNDDEFVLLQTFNTSSVKVTISGGGGYGATAVADVVNTSTALGVINDGDGGKDGITVTSQGKGYTSTPTVTITGTGGSNATATATVSGGKVTSILVNNGGSGYSTIGRFFLVKTGTGGGSGSIKSPVKYATTANIALSGEQSIDGTTTVTNRVLVKDQTTASENGIYVTATGAWARSTDMATASTIEGGTMVYVTDGTVNGDNLFGLTTEGTVTVGTGNQAWANLTAGGANQTLSNLTSPTSVNQDLVMQNGFAITNVDGVYFNTRITTPAIPAITYDGTDIFAKGSGAEVNLTSTTNNWSDITIDVNKDMNNKQLTNLNAVVSTSNVTATGFIFNTSSGNPSKITSSATSDIMGFMVDGVEKGSFAKDGTLDTIFEVAGNPSPMMKFSSTATGSNRVVGTIQFDGLDLTPSRQTYGLIYGWSRDVGASSKEGELQFNVMKSNVSTGIMKMDGTGLLPYADNSSVLGSASLGWSEIRSKGNIYGSTYNFVTSSGNPSKITSDSDSEGIGFQINGAEKVKFFLDGFGDTEIEIKGTINPVMKFYSTATGADRVVGGIYFDGLDSASSQETYALIYGRSRNASSTAKEGEIQFNVMKSNSSTPIMKMDGTGLLPHTDDTFTLGSPSLGWSEIRSTGNIYGKEYKFVTTSGTAPSGNGIIYFDGTDIWAKTGSGSKSLSNIGSGGASGANLTLSNLSSPIAINQTLLPNISGGVIYSLGSGSAKWRNIFTEKLGFGITAMTMPTTTGTNGQVLTTDGSSTLSWSTAGATGATIELDNLGTTSLNASLNMNTNVITFDADADTSIYSTTDDELLFYTGGSVRLKMENSRFLFSNDITMLGNSGAGTENDINLTNNSITFTDTTQQITSLADGIKYLVPTNDTHNFSVNGDTKLTISGTTVTITDPISMNTVNKITNLATPTSDYDASTKKYVDDNAGSLYGIQDYEIPTQHESSQWDFENYITNSKNGMAIGQTGGSVILNVNWYVPVYIAKDVIVRELGFNSIAKTTGLANYAMALFSNRSGSSSTNNVSGDGQNYPYKRLVNASAGSQGLGNSANVMNVYQSITAGLYWICLNITYTQSNISLPYIHYHSFDSANSAGYFKDDGSLYSDYFTPICCYYDSDTSIPSTADNDMNVLLSGEKVPALFIKCT